jgi:RNA polymerase sigma-54 factor
MIKQQLTHKQQQKLSPAQIQQIRMLELTSLEIENRINQELEENPALEEATNLPADDLDLPVGEYAAESVAEPDSPLADYLTEDDAPDYALNQYYQTDERRREISASESESFQEYFLNQLRLKHLSDDKFRIGEYIIGNIDDDGYLRRNPEALADDLAFQYGWEVAPQEIMDVTALIQQLDPPGIAAADLRQCLLLQLRRKEATPDRQLAILILDRYFEAFSKKQYDKIIRALHYTHHKKITDEQLKRVIKEITLLNPKPGSSWESRLETKMAQITPDFIVEASGGELLFTLPDEHTPELRISREYSNMLRNHLAHPAHESASTRDALAFVRQKIDSAKWFIDAIRQRNTTLRRTMLAIIDIQRDFFLSGEESDLKPMKLRDVSQRCGYDLSTISRVSNSKYVQTNWAIHPLRFFFSEGITNEEGEEVSVREIKSLLRTLVDREDKTKPLTDDALMAQLKRRGYDIARRTVAKYREQQGIPVARLRKEIA